MKFNPTLRKQVGKFKDYIILVEGKKGVTAMKQFGFEKVFAIHITGVPLRERIEQISSTLNKKDKVCILTDLNKKGKKLYMLVKALLQEYNAKLDSTLRGILIKSRVKHIEDMSKFMKQVEDI